MHIKTDVMGTKIHNTQRITSRNLREHMERLSTGLRINSAKDDSAGLAISERLKTQINGNRQSIKNVKTGIDLTSTADGVLSSVQDQLAKLQELYIQIQNGTYSDSDKQSIQKEAEQIISNINNQLDKTTFNGKEIFKGREFNGLQFTGSQITTIPYGSGIDTGSEPHTYEIWVNSQSTGNRIIFGLDSLNRIYFGQNAGEWTMGIDGYNFSSLTGLANIPITQDEWNQLVITMDGTEAKLYVNGEYSFSLNYTPWTTDSDFYMGAWGTTGYNFIGKVDDVRIYNKSFSQEEIKESFNGNINRDVLVGEWLMDETAGNILKETSGKSLDGNTNGIARGNIEYTNINRANNHIHNGSGSKETAKLPNLALSLDSLGLNNLDLRDPNSLLELQSAAQKITDVRTSIGVNQNRMDFTIEKLENNIINTENANSRIANSDMSYESSNLTKEQIKLQASTQMIKANNHNRENVLSLLQG